VSRGKHFFGGKGIQMSRKRAVKRGLCSIKTTIEKNKKRPPEIQILRPDPWMFAGIAPPGRQIKGSTDNELMEEQEAEKTIANRAHGPQAPQTGKNKQPSIVRLRNEGKFPPEKEKKAFSWKGKDQKKSKKEKPGPERMSNLR